jgi:2-polyprenyl-3-methyl-5-hydroxy-6-metoxy-1,4-benzoquinol methylase
MRPGSRPKTMAPVLHRRVRTGRAATAAPRCYLCGSPALRERFARRGRGDDDARAFRCTSMDHASKPRVVACADCGLQYVPEGEVSPRLPDLYAEVVDEKYLKYEAARRKTFASALRKIAPFLPARGGRLLEVGSYCGTFLELARERGFDCVGIEPSRWAAGHARESKGLEVHTGALEDFPAPAGGGFDVAVMWDVLEHLRDPRGALERLAGLLAEGGVLCLSTLDIESWLPRLLGKRWPWIMEMHLFYFGRRVLERMLAEAGFEVLRVSTYCHHIAAEYFLEKLESLLPWPLSSLARAARRICPAGFYIPFRFGDIKLFVARKR